MTMRHMGFRNVGFMFLAPVSVMFGILGIFQYVKRDRLMEYLLNYYKDDEKRAKEYYGYQMVFIKAFMVIGAVLFLWALYAFFNY